MLPNLCAVILTFVLLGQKCQGMAVFYFYFHLLRIADNNDVPRNI